MVAKIQQYGQCYYSQEHDYKEILNIILNGESLKDFNQLQSSKADPLLIVDSLAKIYDKAPRLDDCKSAVDNFS
jgi:hypothetical protein